jgi:hypothetical protein
MQWGTKARRIRIRDRNRTPRSSNKSQKKRRRSNRKAAVDRKPGAVSASPVSKSVVRPVINRYWQDHPAAFIAK